MSHALQQNLSLEVNRRELELQQVRRDLALVQSSITNLLEQIRIAAEEEDYETILEILNG